MQAAQELSSPARCSALRVTGRPPASDPGVSELLARSEALRLTAQYPAAENAARSALDWARAHGQAEPEGEALEALGATALARHDGPTAEPFLFDAYEAAERAQNDELKARAATELARAIGELQNRREEAERWLRLASTAVDHVGDDDRLRTDLSIGRAFVESHHGQYAEATAEARAAVARIESKLPSNTILLALALNALGNAAYGAGDEAEAEQDYARSVDLYSRALGPDNPRVALGWANMGVVADLRARFEDSLRYARRALAIFETLGPDHPMIPMLMTDIGSDLDILGRYDEAGAALSRALSLAEANPAVEKDRLATIHGSLARLAIHQKRYDDALREAQTDIAIDADALGPDNPMSEEAFALLGRAYFEKGEARKAQPPLEHALALVAKDHPIWRADCAFLLAKVIWKLGSGRVRATQLAKQALDLYSAGPEHAADAQGGRTVAPPQSCPGVRVTRSDGISSAPAA